MDYFEIVRNSYKIALKQKYLWIFGMLAGGYGGYRSFGLNYSSGSSEWQKAFENNSTNFDFASFWLSYGAIILTLIAILTVFGLVMYIIGIVSQGALIGSVKKISINEKNNFKIGFLLGWHNFWRILGVNILYFLMILASLILLIGPVALLVVSHQYILAIIWGILLFFVDLIFWLLVSFISPYSLRVVVLEKLSVWESIRHSLHMVRDNLGKVIVMYLLLYAISIGVGIAVILAVLFIGGLLLAIGFGLLLASKIMAIIYAIIAGLAVLIGFMVFAGAYNAFYSSALTLTYLELSKKS